MNHMPEAMRLRAEEAVSILQGQVLPLAFENMDKHIVNAWRDSKTPEERERLHLKQLVLAHVRTEIFSFLECAADFERKNNHDGPFRAFASRLRSIFKKTE